MDINLELYKVFYYVATTLSFSEASRQLFISQSAVSQSIKTLEKKLNHPLFIRSTKKVLLTPEGELLQIQSGIMRRYYPYPHRYKNPAGRTGNDINNNYKSQLKRVIILLLMNRHEMIIRLNNLNNISGRFLL